MDLGVTGPEGHLLSRGPEIESEAVRRVITIANHLTSPVYIVHIMSKEACDEVVRARNRGYLVNAETLCASFACDGNMLFHKDFEKAAAYVMSPAISTDPTTSPYLLNHL